MKQKHPVNKRSGGAQSRQHVGKKGNPVFNGCAKILVYGFGFLIFLGFVSAACQGIASVFRGGPAERTPSPQRAVPTATATTPATPTATALPPSAADLPLVVKAASGWQFVISEVRTLAAVETERERMRPAHGAFVVLIGDLKNFSDKDGCLHGRDFKLNASGLEVRVEERVLEPVKKLLNGRNYPGSFMGQCLDYDASSPTFLVFDAPVDRPAKLEIDGTSASIGEVAQLIALSAAAAPTAAPTAAQVAPTPEKVTSPNPSPQAPGDQTRAQAISPALAAEPDAAQGVPGGSASEAAITVAGWNVGLDDADVNAIAKRMAEFDGVDLWGIAEVNRTSAVDELEAAAEQGETGDFAAVLGRSGDAMRLAAFYDDTRFDLLESYELEEINTTGNVRAPLVLHLRDSVSGSQFLFMVNHLYRSRDEERHQQALLLNEWADGKALPVVAVGDYNFDWGVTGGDRAHDLGYDLMTQNGAWEWVRPAQLVTTQCSGWPCQYDSVLDFVFAAGPARDWPAESEIVVADGDFPDDSTKSDHRPVLARFWPSSTPPAAAADPLAAVEPSPTLQPAPTSEPSPTTAPTATTQPTAAPVQPPATPTPVPTAAGAMANRGANLRGGPGTNYPVTGGATAGQALAVVGRSTAGDWLMLADGSWIAAFLVDGAPTALSAVEAPLPPPAPVIEERTSVVAAPVEPPTATPAPPPVVEQPPSNCDPSYPTLCIPVGIGDLDCGDIAARRFPVVGSDPHRFDGDNDGIGCER